MRVRIYKGSLLASLLSLLGTGSLAIGAGLCIGKEILAGIIFVVMGFLLLAWAEKIADRREDKKREMEQMLFETREERQRAIVSIEHRNKIIKGFIVFSAVTLLLGGILETVGSMAEPKYQKTETFLSNKKQVLIVKPKLKCFCRLWRNTASRNQTEKG